MGRSVCNECIESIFSYRGGVAVGGGAAAAVLPSVGSPDLLSVYDEDGGCGVRCSIARIGFSGSVTGKSEGRGSRWDSQVGGPDASCSGLTGLDRFVCAECDTTCLGIYICEYGASLLEADVYLKVSRSPACFYSGSENMSAWIAVSVSVVP